MPEIVIQLAGPDARHRARQFSSQALMNLYLEGAQDPTQPPVCLSFPGKKLLSTGSGQCRGMWVMAETLYKVSGGSLEAIDANGSRTVLGTIPNTDRVVFADDGSNLYLVTGGNLYKWDGSSISNVTPSIVGYINWIAYVNRQFLIGGDGGLFASSDVADGDTYNALNYAEAEIAPDALIRGIVFNQLVYMMGRHTVETWWNSGTGNPPFDRQDNGLVNIGIAGTHAVTHTDQYLYWLTDDSRVYQCVGSAGRSISDVTMNSEIAGFDVTDDAVMLSATVEGHSFVILTFPTANKTYFYDEDGGYWGTLSSGMFGDRDIVSDIVRCYGKVLVSDHRNGNVYEYDADTLTDNGEYIMRRRITLPIENNDRDIIVRELRLICEKGVGIESGQGSEPQVMVAVSRDKGRTWLDLPWRSIGEMGDYERVIRWNGLGVGRSFTFRIQFTDPVPFHIYKMTAWVDYGR